MTTDVINDTQRITSKKAPLFNPTDPAFIANPYPILKQFQNQEPIHRSSLGFWLCTRHCDVEQILNHPDFTHDHETRMVAKHGATALSHSSIRYLSHSILLQNPPHHTKLRKIMAPFFSMKHMATLKQSLEDLTAATINQLAEQGSMDFISDLAQPVLGHLICDILGIPTAERVPFIGATCLSARSLDPAAVPPSVRETLDQQVDELYPYFQSLFQRKRELLSHGSITPTHDLITHMVTHLDTDETLSEALLIDNCLFLFAAGQEVTKCLMGNALIDLHHHPDQWQAVKQNPSLIETGINELLRYSTALQMTHRLASRDLAYKGHSLKAGEPIIISLAAANRDPVFNDHPDQLDLRRTNSKHLSFGRGFHYCIGAHLGTMEIITLLTQLFTRLPSLRVIEENIAWQQTITIRGPSHLQLSW